MRRASRQRRQPREYRNDFYGKAITEAWRRGGPVIDLARHSNSGDTPVSTVCCSAERPRYRPTVIFGGEVSKRRGARANGIRRKDVHTNHLLYLLLTQPPMRPVTVGLPEPDLVPTDTCGSAYQCIDDNNGIVWQHVAHIHRTEYVHTDQTPYSRWHRHRLDKDTDLSALDRDSVP